jgi:hypothetical protein
MISDWTTTSRASPQNIYAAMTQSVNNEIGVRMHGN